MKNKSVVLIGFMGSGKSIVGVKLSYKMQKQLIDTDKMIEQQANRSISEIFATDGEEAFRSMETQALKKLSEQGFSRIISVGGGTPLREENRELLKKCGTVCYLRAKAKTIYDRIGKDTTRPLLQCEDPLARIEELLEKRSAIYEQCADLIVDVDDLSVDGVATTIAGKIQKMNFTNNKRKYLVINGPNINFLGIREKTVYGTQDYKYLLGLIEDKAKQIQAKIEVFQSNHEGAIIDRIQESYFDKTTGIVINPGAYTHYSYAIRDALASITVPKVEIHISDITQREEFRKISVTAPVCDLQIYGRGLQGYLDAIDYLEEKHNNP